MREVVYKYMDYASKGDMKARSLIPAVCTMIGCSTAERNALLGAGTQIPQSWLVLNQAIGTWATTNDPNAEEGSGGPAPSTPIKEPEGGGGGTANGTAANGKT